MVLGWTLESFSFMLFCFVRTRAKYKYQSPSSVTAVHEAQVSSVTHPIYNKEYVFHKVIGSFDASLSILQKMFTPVNSLTEMPYI